MKICAKFARRMVISTYWTMSLTVWEAKEKNCYERWYWAVDELEVSHRRDRGVCRCSLVGVFGRPLRVGLSCWRIQPLKPGTSRDSSFEVSCYELSLYLLPSLSPCPPLASSPSGFHPWRKEIRLRSGFSR